MMRMEITIEVYRGRTRGTIFKGSDPVNAAKALAEFTRHNPLVGRRSKLIGTTRLYRIHMNGNLSRLAAGAISGISHEEAEKLMNRAEKLNDQYYGL